MNVYSGNRDDDGATTVTVNGVPLPPRNDIYNHSPDGFEWGYPGSGPAQLALAILAYELNDDSRALKLHQFFKSTFVSSFAFESWTLTGATVRAWAAVQH